MSTLRKLVFGETWAVPIGVALTLVVGLLLRGEGWWVGFVVLAGAIATLSRRCGEYPERRMSALDRSPRIARLLGAPCAHAAAAGGPPAPRGARDGGALARRA